VGDEQPAKPDKGVITLLLLSHYCYISYLQEMQFTRARSLSALTLFSFISPSVVI